MLASLSPVKRAERWRSTVAEPRHKFRVFVAEDAGAIVGLRACGPQRSTELAYAGEYEAIWASRSGVALGGR